MRHSSSPHPGLWPSVSCSTTLGFILQDPVMPNWLDTPTPNTSHFHAFGHASSFSWTKSILASTPSVGKLPLILWDSTLESSPWENLLQFLPAGLNICFYVCPLYSGINSQSFKLCIPASNTVLTLYICFWMFVECQLSAAGKEVEFRTPGGWPDLAVCGLRVAG